MNRTASQPFLAHQFDTLGHQFAAGKLGMWVLIVTELLFFSGLFCAVPFAARRSRRSSSAHHSRLGSAPNTCTLLVSSLTAAFAVQCAQRGRRRLLLSSIAMTILCGTLFMAVKYVEYSHKYEHGLLPGARFNPTQHIWELESFRRKHPEAVDYVDTLRASAGKLQRPPGEAGARAEPRREQIEPLLRTGVLGDKAEYPAFPSLPKNAHLFFGIYFLMTGLHGLHVIGGIGIWVWLFVRARAGIFGRTYFGPIDYAALYWHLVDLIWLYLFPLLYLVH